MIKNNICILTSLMGFMVSALLSSCNNKEEVNFKNEPTITQGIYGQVLERYGDWMPVADGPEDNSRGYRPLIRDVYVYAYTNYQEFDSIYYCYYPADKMPNPLVAKTTSNKDGFYQISLEPGTYSFFVLEEGRMYANFGDGYGGLAPITIIADSARQVNLVIDHGVD